MDDRDLLRYSRHILLDEIDLKGQEQLLNASALVIGCGGLGASALPFLAASGLGNLTIVDNDDIDDTNLQRQVAFSESDIGHNKANVLKKRLLAINHRVHVEAINQRVDFEDLIKLMQHCDIVLDCTDNFATRQAINKASVHTKTPLISGSAVKFAGQVVVFRPDQSNSGCYACLFEADHYHDGACALLGVFSPVVGIIGATQAAEAIKVLLNIGKPNGNILFQYHALNSKWKQFAFDSNPDCKVCGSPAWANEPHLD